MVVSGDATHPDHVLRLHKLRRTHPQRLRPRPEIVPVVPSLLETLQVLQRDFGLFGAVMVNIGWNTNTIIWCSRPLDTWLLVSVLMVRLTNARVVSILHFPNEGVVHLNDLLSPRTAPSRSQDICCHTGTCPSRSTSVTICSIVLLWAPPLIWWPQDISPHTLLDAAAAAPVIPTSSPKIGSVRSLLSRQAWVLRALLHSVFAHLVFHEIISNQEKGRLNVN